MTEAGVKAGVERASNDSSHGQDALDCNGFRDRRRGCQCVAMGDVRGNCLEPGDLGHFFRDRPKGAVDHKTTEEEHGQE